MKLLLVILFVLLLTSCGYTKFTYYPDGRIEWTSNTLWKDVKDVDVAWDGKIIKLGSSEGNGREEVIACLLAPQLCQ
jgi:hypothetical protein